MTLARCQEVDPAQTPYYHCTTRCVRRSFLYSDDRYSGRNFDHHKHWVEARLTKLSGIFGIDLVAYSAMSNHYHVMVRIDLDRVQSRSDDEVVDRWIGVFNRPEQVDPATISTWRDGPISTHLPPILERLSMDPQQWLAEMKDDGKWYYRAVGSATTMQVYCEHFGQRWLKGVSRSAGSIPGLG